MECHKEEEEFSLLVIINQLKFTKDFKNQIKQIGLTEEGTIANAFPVAKTNSIQEVELKGDLVEITNNFNKNGKLSPFQNTGLLIKGKVYTTKTEPNYDGKELF